MFSKQDLAALRKAMRGVRTRQAKHASGRPTDTDAAHPEGEEQAQGVGSGGLSEADRRLFRRAMEGVVPLRQERVERRRRRPRPLPLQTLRDEAEVLRDMLGGDFDPAELETGEELHYARPGLQHGLLRKLRRGQFSVGAELDLHGKTVSEARLAVNEFTHRARVRGIRCVRIIHGKGKGSLYNRPVLKGKLDRWLRRHDEVLAFSSARPEDGGTGAVYVLLKRL
jgi:DNA-nicking Smr family endonuclease